VRLPIMSQVSSALDGVTGFTGYNHNLKIGNSEFYDQKNISGDLLPVVSPRPRRGVVRTLTKANGLFANAKLGWVDGTDVYYNGEIVGTVTDSEKTIIRMGAYVLIWPDKVYYNTATDVFGALEASYTSTTTVSATLCKADGTPYTYAMGATAPSTPADGAYWLDTSGEKDYLKQYSDALSSWQSIPTVYVKISSTGIGTGFSEYDGVTISGMDDDELNGKFYLVSKGDDYIVVVAVIRNAIVSNTAAVTVKREIPTMEHLTECNNRIWGCNSTNNELYACALGDPKNWNQFMGLNTDSYALSLGSAGAFTGATTHLGNVLFFKENMVHQVMGTLPSNFSTDDMGVRGVASGSAKSLCVVNEVLYYRSVNDVCAFTQSLPVSISEALGNERYKNAVAGELNGKYYLCMEDALGAHVLFTFDTYQQVWCKEDSVSVRWFAHAEGELYFIAGNILYSVGGNITDYADANAALEAPVTWMLETGDIGLDAPFNKYITGIQLYASAELGTALIVEAQYNAVGAWNEVFRGAPVSPKSMVIPITTPRCRTLKLRIKGTGDFKLWSLTRRTMAGSDA